MGRQMSMRVENVSLPYLPSSTTCGRPRRIRLTSSGQSWTLAAGASLILQPAWATTRSKAARCCSTTSTIRPANSNSAACGAIGSTKRSGSAPISSSTSKRLGARFDGETVRVTAFVAFEFFVASLTTVGTHW
jgi:hypothetical protein